MRALDEQQGPAAALDLRALYAEHAPALRAALVRLSGPRLDPDDLLHEVFLVAVARAGDFQGRSQPRTWLYGIALKVVASARRKARLRAFLGLEALPEAAHPADPHTPAAAAERAEARAQVHALLDKLSEPKRAVFVLYELEGLSGEEIAQVVGCPLKTVWTRLYHARREFLAHLARAEALGQARALPASRKP